MARVTVYVPEELWKRVEKVKDEIQLSSLFQSALKQELERLRSRKEILNLNEENVWDTLAEKLRKERDLILQENFKRGVEEGINWAKMAAFPILWEYVSNDAVTFNELPDDVQIKISNLEFENPYEIFTDEYAKGWWKGLRDAWAILEEKLMKPQPHGREKTKK